MDSWRKFDPERPSYRFFPNFLGAPRTPKQTMWIMSTLLGIGVFFSYVSADWFDNYQSNNYEKFARGYVERLPEAASSGAYARTEAYREFLYKLRRQQMGLPERPPQRIKIVDPEESLGSDADDIPMMRKPRVL
ncbi:unnamed protein product [Vitrella brassicaformis CCMP3155]|uniref:Uncharacterized protein n=2 Tax=Vitrella brassicaformis TaxID=1169539 RepID=A0A0G4GLD9_VITBC|nr:unnamed protein product [Vitrella brassicaformis CCMP3155]|eukprot:CEM30936.1 unnamed protein product [Vitrella brassicaformis CCMP3155]